MKSYSQSKQDLFALLVNDNKPGFFIDVGCSSPEFQSNVKLLMEQQWIGVCVDFEDFTTQWRDYPNALYFNTDATKFNWKDIVKLPGLVDYASVDIDFHTTKALEQLFKHNIHFKCATVEHDSYRFGDEHASEQRKVMCDNGYLSVRLNVVSKDVAYEDWWVHKTCPNYEFLLKEVSNW